MPARTRSTRRSQRLLNKELAKAAAAEEEGLADSPSKGKPKRRSSRKKKDTPGEEFRHAVQSMLDSPDKVTLRRKRVIAPSPRVDKITIQNKNSQEAMEFLIPPKRTSEPLEIREQIRSALNFNDDEPTPTYTGGSLLDVPIKDGATGLWSPGLPDADPAKHDRIAKQLIAAIFTILFAVFCMYYQTEIIEAIYSAATQTSAFAWSFWEWLSCSAASIWGMIRGLFSSQGGDENGTVEDVGNMDDSVTR